MQIKGGDLDSGTNYDAPLDFVRVNTDFDSSGVTGDNINNVSYFLSEGQPNEPGGNDTGIGTSDEAEWKTFLDGSDVRSFALGMGSLNASDLDQLEPIAYNGTTGTDQDGTGATDGDAQIVTDLNQLSDVLVSTVGDIISSEPVSGNLLDNSSSGADQWASDVDPNDASIVSATFGGDTHLFTSADDEITFDLGETGSVTIEGDGDYTWAPGTSVDTDVSASIDFTAQDGDGDMDSASFILTLLDDGEV